MYANSSVTSLLNATVVAFVTSIILFINCDLFIRAMLYTSFRFIYILSLITALLTTFTIIYYSGLVYLYATLNLRIIYYGDFLMMGIRKIGAV